MKISLRGSILTVGVLTFTSLAFGQKKNETSAAVVYKQQYQMNIAKGKMDEAKKSLIEAKGFIDLAAAHEDTKNNQKTLWLKGEIYSAFLTLGISTMDTNFMKLAGEDAMNIAIASFKQGYPLGKKYKSDIVDAVNKNIILLKSRGGQAYEDKLYNKAAEAYTYEAKFNEAINLLDTNAVFNAALCNENAQNYLAAAKGYEELTKVNYRGTKSVIYAASAYRRAGDIEKAKAILNEARKEYPSDKDLLLELVNTNIDAGDAAGAESALADALSTDPNNKQLHYTIGTIYIDLKENEKAEAELSKALEIDPNYVDAQYQLGAHLVSWAGDLNTEARKLKFGDAQYDVMIAKSQDIYKRAVAPLENYIAGQPKDKAVLNILFQLHRNLGNTEKALEFKKRAEAL